MKTLGTKKKTKNLIIIFAIIVILSGLIPSGVQAKTDTEEGGGLLEPIEKFVVFLGDKVMQWLQSTFTSTDDIKQSEGVYNYQYSPAIIFSGTVPAFDINFIVPNEEKETSYTDFLNKNEKEYYDEVMNDSTCNMEQAEYLQKYEAAIKNNSAKKIINTKRSNITTYMVYYEVVRNDKNFLCVEYFVEKIWRNTEVDTTTYSYKKYEYQTDLEEFEEAINVYESAALMLQPTIATWYKALRRIALVGLLSVLVYVGIRIVLTSSAAEKAKYKGMLIDWLTAVCILFTLHYIMSITITVTNKISSIFSTGETDVLLNTLRGDIHSGASWGEVLAKVIMYTVLVINTLTFTIQYLKRVIYMAFYTLIAPLIALTYPLDKIKDGQAQAFNTWIREYLFTALIQIIHLVVYTVLIGSALDLVTDYPLYAIIVLFFMSKADDIIKKMFGFSNSETVGTIGAAAAGGLVMNAISKLSSVAPKGGKTSSGGSQGAGGSSNVRTASNNALASLRDGGSSGEGAPSLGIKNAIGGATSLGGKFIKTAGGAALRGGLGVTGAMLGFAAGVSQGDLKAAGAGLLAGGKAGSAVGKRLSNGVNTDAIKQGINNIKDTWNEGAFGADFAQGASEAREFKRTSAYKSLRDKYGDNLTDESLRAMLSADIKDAKTMEKVLDSGNISDAIGYYTLAKKCPDSIYYDDNKLKMYLEDLGLSQTDAETMRRNMKTYR